jgi:cytochrome bd-type quinol oxidase subunit 2
VLLLPAYLPVYRQPYKKKPYQCAGTPAQSQGFMLVGALLIIPIILVYTFWSYYVFRGKVQPGEGYH